MTYTEFLEVKQNEQTNEAFKEGEVADVVALLVETLGKI